MPTAIPGLRAFRTLWVVLAAALLTGLLLAALLFALRKEVLQSGEARTQALAQVIAEQTTRTLQSLDSRLQLAALRLDQLAERGALDEAAAREVLRDQLLHQPFVRAAWVLDARGEVRFHTEAGWTGLSEAGASHFQAIREQPAPGFLVRLLTPPGQAGPPLLAAARPLHEEDGGLRGAVVAALEPGWFEALWRSIDLGRGGAIALLRRDGVLLARSPALPGAVGSDLSQAPLIAQDIPAAEAGVRVRASPLDGLTRVVAYRVLPADRDLVVAVGSSYAALLAPWHRVAWLTAGLWGFGVAAALLLGWQLQRHKRGRQRTEQRLLELAQAMPQIVFLAGPRGSVEFVSDRWEEVTGRPPSEALHAGWQQWVHPDDRPSVMRELEQRLQAGATWEIEGRLQSRDGGYRWQLLRAVPVRDGAERISWFGTATDIDDLKRAQERLQAQAGLLAMAGRLARLGGWQVDVATRRISFTEEAAALLDLPADWSRELRELTAMITPASLPVALRQLESCIERGTPFDAEVEIVTPTGRRVWLRSIGHAVRDPEGRIVALQGAQQDITGRVRMVEEIRRLNAGLEQQVAQRTSALSRQEALFRALAEQAPLPIWTVEPGKGASFFSRAWYALVGGAPPDWQGEKWRELLHPEDLPVVLRDWEEAQRSGRTHAGTRRIRARDGTYHTTSFRAVPVQDAEGKLLFWVGIDSDITELMANQAALRLANEQLEAFAYSVSHDLQSPLQRVLSFVRLLEQELGEGDPPRARHYAARIRANAETMAQLIEGLLALAQVTELEVIRTRVDLSEMATEVLRGLQAHEPQRNVRWRVQPGLAVTGDARLLRSVLDNLVGNAWKFTGGKAEARIEVGACEGGGEYYVRDNGAGFDMAYAGRLFGTFQRLHDADAFPGTGIGLATVARALSRLGGTIRGEARPGEGAVFTFTLPPA